MSDIPPSPEGLTDATLPEFEAPDASGSPAAEPRPPQGLSFPPQAIGGAAVTFFATRAEILADRGDATITYAEAEVAAAQMRGLGEVSVQAVNGHILVGSPAHIRELLANQQLWVDWVHRFADFAYGAGIAALVLGVIVIANDNARAIGGWRAWARSFRGSTTGES